MRWLSALALCQLLLRQGVGADSMVADSTAVVSTEAVSAEAVMAAGLLAMAMPMATDMLDVDTTADTTADGAVTVVTAAASTPRSGVPTRHIIVVFSEGQGSQVTPVFTP